MDAKTEAIFAEAERNARLAIETGDGNAYMVKGPDDEDGTIIQAWSFSEAIELWQYFTGNMEPIDQAPTSVVFIGPIVRRRKSPKR